MKKTTLFLAGAISMSLVSCGALGTAGSGLTGNGVLSSLAHTATQGETLTNILTSFIGGNKATEMDLVGTWKYSQPGCAFTSENALAQAGGEVVAQEIKNKLNGQFQSLGVKSSNTQFTFGNDNTFSAKLLGKSVSGTYTFDPATQAINLSINLLGVPAYTLNGFVKKNATGISLLFESKKVLGALQTLGVMSGNNTLNSISQLASNYNAVRIGFDLTK